VKEKEKDIVFNYVPKTRERSRGENPANTKKKGEEATLVKPGHFLTIIW
jgi:hypothetical protein